jgi:hypothetical protein
MEHNHKEKQEERPSRARVTLEVLAVFLLAVLLFRGIHSLPFLDWEAGLAGSRSLLLVEYVALLGMALLLIAARRNPAGYGLTLQCPRDQLRVAGVGLLPVLFLSSVLGWVDWSRWGGALIVSLAALAMLPVAGWALKGRHAVAGAAVMGVWLMLASRNGAEWGGVALKTFYFYALVAPAEELLFRGYIQSRLNEAYGRPYRFFGVAWGWGVVGAALLFGLWHVAFRPLDAAGWMHGLWTFFGGLLLGYFRERSGGVAAPSLLHGVLNYVPLFDLLGG